MSVTITEKQKRYAHLTIENLKSKKPKGKAQLLKEAGYEMVHPNAHKVEQSKNYQEYFKQQVSEKTLKDIHKKLLNASILRREQFPLSIDDAEIAEIMELAGVKLLKIVELAESKIAFCRVPVLDTVMKATDMAYKILGNYAPEKHSNLNLNLELIDTDQISKLTDNLNSQMRELELNKQD